jgi:hypothetical protein
MWNRRVIFFANLLSIFFGNEEQTRVLSNQVGELDSYSARLIPILNLLFRGSDNQLVVEREPDPVLCAYFEQRLGLSLPKIVVLNHDDYLRWGQRIKNQSDADPHQMFADINQPFCIDGYVTDETLSRFSSGLDCPTVSTSEASKAGNNKWMLHQFLLQRDLPTLDTVIAETGQDLAACAKQLAQQGYASAIIRSQIGASGIGMMRIDCLKDQEALPRVPEYFFYEGPCLVQGWLAPGVKGISQIRSPSTQLFLDESTVYAFDMTEQILSSESIHEGNESPPPYLDQRPSLRAETIRQAEIVGGWLHQTGYRGTASIDWLVVERDNAQGGTPHLEVYVCEINARVTGATYPSLLAKHFHPSGAWLLRNLRLNIPAASDRLLQIFDQAGHLYHPDRRAGILPLNFNFGADGLVHKGQFVCIGDNTDQCHHFLRLAEQDLPGNWLADRD